MRPLEFNVAQLVIDPGDLSDHLCCYLYYDFVYRVVVEFPTPDPQSTPSTQSTFLRLRRSPALAVVELRRCQQHLQSL